MVKTGRGRYWYLIPILVILALVTVACAGSGPTPQAVDVGDSDTGAQAADEDEHMEDETMGEHMEGDEHEEDEHMEGEHEDEHEHVHADLPHEFEDLENPFANDPAAIAAGAELYAIHCATCHGETGMGDGPAAAGLDPKPASHADGDMMGDISDAYIFWRISEGGTMEPFNSAMPPWGEVLTEEQIWQLVNFIRTLAQ